MIGDDLYNLIFGRTGNDKLSGEGGNDDLLAAEGDDTANGGAGNDFMAGGQGSDQINGGEGDDSIFHNNYVTRTPNAPDPTSADGSKDTIDCGPGNDVAVINEASDGDVTINCETVHPP
jgi:Ca2+-binding RTX toxin-like protein